MLLNLCGLNLQGLQFEVKSCSLWIDASGGLCSTSNVTRALVVLVVFSELLCSFLSHCSGVLWGDLLWENGLVVMILVRSQQLSHKLALVKVKSIQIHVI